jgi:hypothetical protein
MTVYYRCSSQNKVYKLVPSNNTCLIYWVAVFGEKSGRFFHGRGADVVENYDMGLKFLELMGTPTTEEDYLKELKNYFAADKIVREQFIKAFKL